MYKDVAVNLNHWCPQTSRAGDGSSVLPFESAVGAHTHLQLAGHQPLRTGAGHPCLKDYKSLLNGAEIHIPVQERP